MNEEKDKETTDDGQPTTDNSGLDKQQANYETSNEIISSTNPNSGTEQTSYIPDHTSYIKDMEVHHHTHAAHGNKNCKNYFWEFLMLFLAVFCGFLAENFREHYIEGERAKGYISSLYEDLKTDTTRLNFLINKDNEKIQALNGMTSCYDTVIKNLKATSCMGMLVKYSRSNIGFIMTDRTLRQLANAGGFRMLDKGDADSILIYENMCKNYENFQSTIFQGAQDNIRNTLNQLADFKINAPLQVVSTQNADTISANLQGPLLFSDDRVLLNKWFNELALYLRVTLGQRNQLAKMRERATNLIEYYKKKHHLE